MKKRGIVVFLLLTISFILFGGVVQASAIESTGQFSFYIGGDSDIEDGGVVNYSQFCKNVDQILEGNEDETITITLRNTEGIAPGTQIFWTPTNTNIITKKSQDDVTFSVQLNIKSPGYSGLSVTIIDPDGTTHSACAFCTIYVPLEWSDKVSSTYDIMNNLFAATDPYQYGLLYAQAGDSTGAGSGSGKYTVQLYASEDSEHPERSHYIRKLRYMKYEYASDDPTTAGVDETTLPSVRSDIEKDMLGRFSGAIEWTSSDSSVAEVDSLTGFVTAKKAGFATITVRTTTTGNNESDYGELSYDVVVVPEAYVSGYNSAGDIKKEGTVIWDSSSVILQTNARFASDLSWKVYQGDGKSKALDITASLKDDMEISDSSGRFVLNNLKAGVYTIAAVPIKGGNSPTDTPTYDPVDSSINSLEYYIVVPVKMPPENVILSYYNSNIYDSYDLLANSNLPAGIFRFSSKKDTIAKVGTDSGIIDAAGEGETEINIVLSDKTKFRQRYGSFADNAAAINFDLTTDTTQKSKVTVYDGIAISASAATMNLGSTLQLSLTAPSPYQGELTWSSSDKSICSVDETGLVKALKTGEAVITVTISVGNGVTKRAQCAIKVVSSVENIELKSNSNYVGIDENLTISATITPNVSGTELKWTSSDPAVAVIATENPLSATIKGIKEGTVVITAVNPANGVVATKIITVISEITSITLSDTEVVIPKSAGFYQLYATCLPKLPENEKLTWSSTNKKVVTVDDKGKVSVVNPGEAIINVVSSNGKMASCKFIILQGVESITFDEKVLTMFAGDNHRMTYTVGPDSASDKTVKWITSDSKIATVDSTGFITAKNVGTCTITAQAQDGSGIYESCTVTVLRNATDITIDVKELTLNVGESYTLDTQLKPADATDSVKYESTNTKVATVSANGKIIAKAKGSCLIFARTDAGVSTYCNVTVTQQVTDLSVDPAKTTMYVGDTLQLNAVITPTNASDKEVTWESDDKSVVTVDENGLVTAVGGGATLVKCYSDDSDLMAYAQITVVERVTTITLESEELKIAIGEKKKLTATISGEKATNKNVKWASSNKKICKITKNGTIKGMKAGTCTIRCKAADGSGVYADCEITVYRATKDIELSATYAEITQGKSIKLKATTTPAKPTYSVVWSSDNEKVATVTKKGKITGLKTGDCTITCTAGDNSEVYAVCYVHVVAPEKQTSVAISSITFSEDSVVLLTGESNTIQYSIAPTNYTESFSWSSSNSSVASVDGNGKIVAKSVGSAKITAMSKSGKKSTINVYVVGLSKTKITLHQYESTKINLQLDGADSKDIDVRWDTDNQGIAEISNGKVTGKALGTTTVYAIVNGRYLACTVKVIKN